MKENIHLFLKAFLFQFKNRNFFYLLISIALSFFMSLLLAFVVFALTRWGIESGIQFLNSSGISINRNSIFFTIFFVIQYFFVFSIFFRFLLQFSVYPVFPFYKKYLQKKWNLEIKEQGILNIKNFIKSLFISFKFTIIYFFLFIVSFLLGPFQLIFLFCVNAFFFSYGIYDFYFDDEFQEVSDKVHFLRKIWLEIFIAGLLGSFLIFVPFFGVPIAGYTIFNFIFFKRNRVKFAKY